MATKTIDKIIKTIREIPEDDHKKILEIVKDFKKGFTKRKKEGKWDRFFGIISDEQAEAMLAVIEQECERVEDGD